MSAILDRLISKIEAAPLDPVPSGNIYMEEVFEPQVYQEILSNLPDVTSYNFLRGTENRLVLALYDETIERLDGHERVFWEAMYKILSGKPLMEALVNKFSDEVHARFGDDRPEMVMIPTFYRDFPGYFIKIHPDSHTKVATMQFYLPRDNSQIHLGTSFHKQAGDDFVETKTNPFKPNSAYAFVRTDHSWHSVKKMAQTEANRDTLALTIYIKGQEYKQEPRHSGYE